MLVFIDETGDHSLDKIDPQYPLFGLGALIIDEDEYAKLEISINEIKKEFFEDDGTFILHASELKRPTAADSDPRNRAMKDADTRRKLYKAIDEKIILPHKMYVVACFIRKQEHKKKYATPMNPYYFSFENLLNRILRYGSPINHIYAENRGPELDTELLAEYERFTKVGIEFSSAAKVSSSTTLKLRPKKDNINGLQVIDLILSSLARSALGKDYKMDGNDLNPAYIRLKYPCPATFFPSKRSLFNI